MSTVSARANQKKKDKASSSKKGIPTGFFGKMELNTRRLLGLMLIITFAAFIPVLFAGFVNWDDQDYVYWNPLIKHNRYLLDLILTPKQGNYHPITMLSLALNYRISGESAWSFHLFNLLFHLVNTGLVFRLAMQLSANNRFVAFTTALLFAIHPMHVESVAWVSERKDVLYTLFFLLGMSSYVKYVDMHSRKAYFSTILFLVLSLLSKPAAVIFPVSLFAIDILRMRSFNAKLVLEKLPHFILAAIIGYLTYKAQETAGGVKSNEGLSLILPGYAIMMYLIKALFPFNLSPFYQKFAGFENYPGEYFIGPVVTLLFLGYLWIIRKSNKPVLFGGLFFLINLALVIQFIPVGGAIIADRYTYVPYIGLFYSIAWLLSQSISNIETKYKTVLVVGILFSVLTFAQASIWNNGRTLWDHAIKTTPSATAMINRGFFTRGDKEYQLGINLYKQAMSIRPNDWEARKGIADIYTDMNYLDSAYANYLVALSINSKDPTLQGNLGALFVKKGVPDSAFYYLNKAIKGDPNLRDAYGNRGLAYMNSKEYKTAILDFQKYLDIDPAASSIYNTIGTCYRFMSVFDSSLYYINKSIKVESLPAYYLNRSYTYAQMNRLDEARKDAIYARERGEPIPDFYLRYLGL